MLIFIILTVLIVISALIIKNSCAFEVIGILGAGIFSTIFVILGICMFSKPLVIRSNLVDYYAMKDYIESTNKPGNTDLINAADRINLGLKITRSYNTEIMKHREFVNDPWVGCFYSREIAELDLLELK